MLHHRDATGVEGMFKRAGVSVVAFLLVLGSAWPTAMGQEKASGKAAADAAKVVEGDLVSLDVKKLTAVVKTDKGNQTVTLGKDVKVVGPRDGVRKDGLEDEQLDKGAKVRLTLAADGKTAKEIKLVSPSPAAGTKAAAMSAAAKAKAKAMAGAGGPSGKIVKVDLAAMKFTIAGPAGKEIEFSFDANTLFIGPRGGEGEKNGKDERFVVGAPVRVVVGAAGKAVKEVHLPVRSAIQK